MAIHDRYPQEVHDFIRNHCQGMRDHDLAELCNRELGTHFTRQSLRSFRANHGYKNGLGRWTSDEYKKYKYPPGMYEFIRDNSWEVSSKDMAEMVNEKFGTDFTQTSMKAFRQRHGIKSGLTGWFQKNHPSGNKGMKQEEFMSPEAIERTKATRFKPGTIPPNTKPVGTISVVDGYKLLKVKDKGPRWEMWKPLHRYVWEQHNGPIPEGMIVVFKDQNAMNCDINNLLLITRAEHAAMTKKKLRSKDPELTEAGLGLVRLERTIKDKKKK